MAFGSKNLATIAAGAVLVALAVVLVYTSLSEPETSAVAPSTSEGAQPAPGNVEQRPLPAEIQRLEQLLEFAREQATKSWRPDARLTRLYATSVAADGSFDRQASVVQTVFVSPEATESAKDVNGWRLSVREGNFGAVEIWQHPPPTLDPRPIRWCSLVDMVGEGAPKRFTLDVHYANRGEQAPVALAFARSPKRWLVGADPFTCEVHDRSRARTEEEEREHATRPDASGPVFDARHAAQQISEAIAASKCRGKDGPSGHGTVQVTFGQGGKAEGVEFLAGSFAGTAAGGCLEKALLGIRVKPWQRGDGRAVSRFVW
jgi:hypothetical protein